MRNAKLITNRLKDEPRRCADDHIVRLLIGNIPVLNAVAVFFPKAADVRIKVGYFFKKYKEVLFQSRFVIPLAYITQDTDELRRQAQQYGRLFTETEQIKIDCGIPVVDCFIEIIYVQGLIPQNQLVYSISAINMA